MTEGWPVWRPSANEKKRRPLETEWVWEGIIGWGGRKWWWKESRKDEGGVKNWGNDWGGVEMAQYWRRTTAGGGAEAAAKGWREDGVVRRGTARWLWWRGTGPGGGGGGVKDPEKRGLRLKIKDRKVVNDSGVTRMGRRRGRLDDWHSFSKRSKGLWKWNIYFVKDTYLHLNSVKNCTFLLHVEYLLYKTITSKLCKVLAWNLV